MPPWNRASLLAAAGVASLLTACAAVGPNFTAPAAPRTPGYAMAGDTASTVPAIGQSAEGAGAWWTALGSADLDRTIRQALSDSPTLAAADATLEQARAAADAQRNAPTGAFNASVERTRINLAAFGIPGFPSPTVNQYSVGGNIAYDLDLFGGIRRANETAGAQAEAQEQHAKAAYLTLTGNVAMAAVRIATLRAQIAAITSVIDEDAKNLEFIRKSQAAGAAMATLPVRVR